MSRIADALTCLANVSASDTPRPVLSQGLDPRIGEEESLDFAMRPGDLEFWLFTETGKLCVSGKRRW